MIKLKLDVEPVPKARPRATKTGKVYTPKKTADYERSIARLVGHLPAQLGALGVRVNFILKRPAKTPKAITGRFMKAGSRGDIDNYIKALLDGCQRGGIVPNDAAVTEIYSRKVYAAPGEEPHIELSIWSLGELAEISNNDDLTANNSDEEEQIARARIGNRDDVV